ncbi:DUF2059 domain-containing protein [Qipengyuania nanhaisediminis]|uniref:DUF2059 domain-containing protein n=1 Tax=Qipengyuania nanhaisediminis TaxID=604088 RepID=UPI0038B33D62
MIRTLMIALGAFAAIAALPGAAIAQDSIARDNDASAIAAPSEANLAIARQIMDLGFPEDTREEIFFAAMDQMMIQMREATFQAYDLEDEGAVAILDDWIAEYVVDSKAILRAHIPSLIEGMARSYAVIFTQRELEDVLAFVATPSGQRYFELSSAVLAEPNFAQANQAYMNETQAQLPGAMQDLVGRLQEYLAAQSDPASKDTY